MGIQKHNGFLFPKRMRIILYILKENKGFFLRYFTIHINIKKMLIFFFINVGVWVSLRVPRLISQILKLTTI